MDKRKKITIGISIALAIVNGFLYSSDIISSNFLETITTTLVNLSIAIAIIWGFRVPTDAIGKTNQYLVTALPAIIAGIVIYMIRSLLQIPEIATSDQAKDLSLFEVGLWFVILPTIAALYVMRYSDNRIKRLENVVFHNANDREKKYGQNSTNIGSESAELQKTMRKQNKNIFWLTIVIAILTAAMLILTVLLYYITNEQFARDNFEPSFNFNEAQVILLEPRGEPQLEYMIPLEMSTMTSHNYKFTIIPTENSVMAFNAGNCFFKGAPKLSMYYPLTFFLKSDGDDKEIQPNFRLDYESNLPYFTPEQLERSTSYSVGSIQFTVTGENLQMHEKPIRLNATAGLIMKVPSDFNTGEYCKRNAEQSG